MRRLAAILGLAALLSPLGAEAAKPKRCFSTTEVSAEREIRHGIYMREAAKRCDGDYIKGANAMWQKFEAAQGTKFKAANGKRIKAWQREFPDDWQFKMNHADGRLVTYARHMPRTTGLCENIDELLQELDKRGYAAFTVQSKTIHNEVIEDYKVCN
ncbi:hypothetical protein A6A04_14295 [Paramagnetospirillum marisnigri]|uniref:Uncharacterized protein n=1 Tax=Paramagnetospirillum marisnigri TaxID=1285242 RepID=A0A178MVP2_9PROT|nr:hypothetical protein [Paramagnetospirillum marisnigri]OAN53129.1 hypothetical protein A6A04_14295 [Paramagnetospirillum marisnigri]